MKGSFYELCWNDIMRLVYEHVGVPGEEEQREFSETWWVNNFQPPDHPADKIMRVQVYNKKVEERLKDNQ